MKRFLAILMALSLATLTGCSGTQPDAPGDSSTPQQSADSTSSANAGGDYADTIVFATHAEVATLDPHYANEGMTISGVQMLYSTLVKNVDNTIIPDLAKEWSVADDKVTWTFSLRDDAAFHDGTPLTAHHVKTTFDRALDIANGFPTTEIIKMITGVEAVDDYTVTITTNEPSGTLLPILAQPFCGIMDTGLADEYGLNFGMDLASVNGSGPFRLVSWKMDEEMVFAANESYYGGVPPTANVVFKPIPDNAARLIALENGEVDIISNVPTDDIGRLEQMEALQVITKASNIQRVFRFGCNDPIVADPLVRQAIVYAIDKEAIVDALYAGMATVATAPMTTTVPFYHNFGVIPRDVEKSKALLADAGYADGFDTLIVAPSNYYKTGEAAEIMSAQLAEVGINARIEVVEASTHVAKRSGLTPEEFDWPIFAMGVAPASGDPDGVFRGLFTTTETGTNVRNYGFYSNEEVDRLVKEGTAETDEQKRAEIYKRIAEICYLEDPAAIYLYDHNIVMAAANGIEGVTILPMSGFSFEKATLRK